MSDGGECAEGVIQADAFDALETLPRDHAHAAVIDYPWEFEVQNGAGRFEYRRLPGQGDGVGDRDLAREDAMFNMESDERYAELLDELARVLVDGAWLICFADDRFQDVVRDALRESEFTFRRNWAWTPESMGMGYYGRVDHYPIPTATLGDTERYVSDRPTLFRVPGGRQTEYSTGKPVDLYRQLLRPPVVENGERLLEPFCGSGPGAAVASERGLSYWGADVDVDAVKMARSRLETPRLTGQSTLTDGGDGHD
jgi:site-specific DNA-methyltransferase (adenine-specific)